MFYASNRPVSRAPLSWDKVITFSSGDESREGMARRSPRLAALGSHRWATELARLGVLLESR